MSLFAPCLIVLPIHLQGNFVACMTAILRQMEDYHYAHLIKTFGKMRTDVVVSVTLALAPPPCFGSSGAGQTLGSMLPFSGRSRMGLACCGPERPGARA